MIFRCSQLLLAISSDAEPTISLLNILFDRR
jgi:hypothetical protein